MECFPKLCVIGSCLIAIKPGSAPVKGTDFFILRFDYPVSAEVNKSPKVILTYGSQSFAEGFGMFVLWFNHAVALFIDVSPFPHVVLFDTYRSQAIPEGFGGDVFGFDDHLSCLIDISP